MQDTISSGYDYEPSSGSSEWVRLASKGDEVRLRLVSSPVHYEKLFESRTEPGVVEAKTRHLWRVIDRADGSIKLFEAGNQIYLQIKQWVQDAEWGDPSDVEQGYDITVKRAEEGGPAGFYKLTQSRNLSPLTEAEKEAIALHEMENDLVVIAEASAARDPLAPKGA